MSASLPSAARRGPWSASRNSTGSSSTGERSMRNRDLTRWNIARSSCSLIRNSGFAWRSPPPQRRLRLPPGSCRPFAKARPLGCECPGSRTPRVSVQTQQGRQFRQRPDFPIRLAREPFGTLIVSVAPHHLHAEGGCGPGVPGIGRLERDRARLEPQALYRKLIDPRVRLVNPDFLNREHGVQQVSELGALHGGFQHVRGAVGKYCSPHPGPPQPRQRVTHLRKGAEREVKVQQPLPQPAARDLQRVERKVEGLAGHLPEVRMPALQRPQPRILELLFTPK